MKLHHFSDVVVSSIEPRDQGVRATTKPQGFWVSDESAAQSWTAFCRSENYRAAFFERAHVVTLNRDHGMLVLSGQSDLLSFTEQYGEERPGPRQSIRWDKVSAIYTGILITPYVWECRLDTPASGWYYGWDCASGCIWDPSAVRSIELTALAVEVAA